MRKLLSLAFAASLGFGLFGTTVEHAHAAQRGGGLAALFDSLLKDDGYYDEREVYEDVYRERSRGYRFRERRRSQRGSRARDFDRGFPPREYYDDDRADEFTPLRANKKRRSAKKKRSTRAATPKARRVSQAGAVSAARREARRKAAAKQAKAHAAAAKRAKAKSATARKAKSTPNRANSRGLIFEGNERYCSQGALDCNGFKNER